MGIFVCEGVYEAYGYEMTVTSVTDGTHSRASLHYVGFAFDLRTRHIPLDELPLIQKDLQEALTDEFDVVLESNHFHIEFQPKRQ